MLRLPKRNAKTSLDADTLALLEKARTGDELAFAQLLNIYRPTIKKWIVRSLGHVEEPDDLFQEVSMHLYCALPTMYDDEGLVKFLSRLTSNAVINYLRSARRRHTDTMFLSDFESGGKEIYMPARSNTMDDVLHNEFQNALQAAIAQLPTEKMKTAVRLVWFQDCSYAAVAEILGVTPKTIQRLLRSARHRLSEDPILRQLMD